MLAAAGRIRKLVAAFVTLDSIPLEPHYRAAREAGALELTEVDEAMFMWGLRAAKGRDGSRPRKILRARSGRPRVSLAHNLRGRACYALWV